MLVGLTMNTTDNSMPMNSTDNSYESSDWECRNKVTDTGGKSILDIKW